ncbi:hypothetical protein C4D60_Mb06t03270 [Musa balbisiana]|uniref:Uncharacterized protein n=1 Tax=Musa balbisiana TaxID=52838 RepID=A0A4S8ILK8_MUSBA|nr:hypothetical protein C4D60_Mb06t03270 [Musa balbisiana]
MCPNSEAECKSERNRIPIVFGSNSHSYRFDLNGSVDAIPATSAYGALIFPAKGGACPSRRSTMATKANVGESEPITEVLPGALSPITTNRPRFDAMVSDSSEIADNKLCGGLLTNPSPLVLSMVSTMVNLSQYCERKTLR